MLLGFKLDFYFLKRIHWALAMVMAWSGVAYANPAGHIYGTLSNDQELPVGQALVTLEPIDNWRGRRSVRSSTNGVFQFSHVDPGKYKLVVVHPLYRKEERVVRVKINFWAAENLILIAKDNPDAGNSERDDEGEKLVDPRTAGLDFHVENYFSDHFVADRTVAGLALFSPGVIRDANRPSSLSIHGGRAGGNRFYLDGIPVTHAVSGLHASTVAVEALEDMVVSSGGLHARYNPPGGGVVSYRTKSGSEHFGVDGSIYVSPNQLILLDEGELNASNSLRTNLQVSGPIIPRKMHFFFSSEYLDTRDTVSLEELVYPEIIMMQPQVKRGFHLLGKLDYKPLEWQEFTLFIQGDPSWSTYTYQDERRHPLAENEVYEGGVNIGISSMTRLEEVARWLVRLYYNAQTHQSSPVSQDYDTPGHQNLETWTHTINDSLLINDAAYRLGLLSSLTLLVDDLFGPHNIELGAEADVSWSHLQMDYTGGERFIDRGISLNNSSISGAGDPYLVERVIAPQNEFTWANHYALYIQDTWVPFDNFSVLPGLRIDSTRAYLDPAQGGQEILNKTLPSFRLGASWDPFSDGKTAIRGGYYQYAETGSLNVVRRASPGLKTETYAYNSLTGEYDQLIETNSEQEPSESLDNLFTGPLVHEAVLGVSRQFFASSVIHWTGIYRLKTNLFEDRETNIQWNESGSGVAGYDNGEYEKRFVIGSLADAMWQYWGMDLVLEKKFEDDWSFLLTYNFSTLQGTSEDEFDYSFDNPTQADFESGYLLNDIRHTLRAQMSYALPYGLLAGVTAQYQSGRTYSKLYYNEVFRDYVDRRAARGFDPRQVDDASDDTELRLPDTFLANLRLSWHLKELTDQDIRLIVEVRNLLNLREPTRVENRLFESQNVTPFGATLERAYPLRGTLAIRYRF